MRWYIRSKIHGATVTESNIGYVGSITVDKELMDKTGLNEGEKVAVWDITNGMRLETYIVGGKKNSGTVCLNGAAAKRIKKGDKIIIAGFELSDKEIAPKIILVNEKNKFIKYL